MGRDAMVATWSTFARNGRLWIAWSCWIYALFVLYMCVSAPGAELFFLMFLFLIWASAFLWGSHLHGLRRLARLHRWPDADRTLMTVAIGWMVGVLCLLPAAAFGGFGATGAAIAVCAWGAVGLGAGLGQISLATRRYLTILLLPLWALLIPRSLSRASVTIESLLGIWPFWVGLGAAGWLVALFGFELDAWFEGRLHRIRRARRRPVSSEALNLVGGVAHRRPPSGFPGRVWQWQAGLHPLRFVGALCFMALCFWWSLNLHSADLMWVALVIPLFGPCLSALESWDRRMSTIGEESLRPRSRRSLARELTGSLGLEVALYWVILALFCYGVVFFSRQTPGTTVELWHSLLGSLMIQPLLLTVVTVGILGSRSDQIFRKALVIVGYGLVVLLATIFNETAQAWVVAISPGSSTWSPWASTLVLVLGVLGVVSTVRRFENLELGRCAAHSSSALR